MEALLLKVFSESGLIYLLFFMIVGGFIWKGIPYLLEKYDKTTESFVTTLKELQTAHNENIHSMNTTFLAHIEKNDNGHQVIHSKLDEIRVLIEDRKPSKKK